MITLITGGSGSGKSAYAEKYICHASNEKEIQRKILQLLPCRYLMMRTAEDRQAQKTYGAGKGFITIEQPLISKMRFLSCNQKAV